MPIHTHFFQRVILTCKVGQTDIVFGVQSGFISRSVLHYKSLCAAAMVCATLVNKHHRQRFNQLIQIAQPAQCDKTGYGRCDNSMIK